ncbi:MAG TPA: CheR family methyltransferase [Nitrospirota bacterium]|nr:CheR family methyltransferase [Nitrospirota bacterium]
MQDIECTEFLQRCLPRLRLRWAGYRKVRQQVCRRLSRRISELGLSGLSEYQSYLESNAEEWPILDSHCNITISRFYRDHSVFDVLQSSILPILGEEMLQTGGKELLCWSAGCCSGEEAYTLQIIWKASVIPLLHANPPLRIIATDVDQTVLERARKGWYRPSSLRDLPQELIEAAFTCSEKLCSIREPFRENIEFFKQDIRKEMPDGPFHLILCRNLVFTYFDETLQRDIVERIVEKLVPGGILVIGTHESIPHEVTAVTPYENSRCIYRKAIS